MEGEGRTEEKRGGGGGLEGTTGIERGRERMEVGNVTSERVANALTEGRGVPSFTEEPDFGWRVGETGVNKEPVETSWERDFGEE
jgi:hypothetical protein